MAVTKDIEQMADSSKNWEDTAQAAANKAHMSLKGIRSVSV